MKEHASLIYEESKPLVDAKEIKELAIKHVLAAVETEIKKLTENDEQNIKIIGLLEEIKQAVIGKDNETSKLKFEVLQQLKAKLEAST